METGQIKLSVEDIIEALYNLDNNDRMRLQNALFELQNDLELHSAIQEGLDDIKSGRVSAHESVMKEIKEKYS